MAQASWDHAQGRSDRAEVLCNQILGHAPGHVHALNLLGLVLQTTGRHKQAVKALNKAVASDPFNAACHYNLASSYQALNRRDEAAIHFEKSINFGASQNNTEKLILQNPVIATSVQRIEETWPLPVASSELFSELTLAAIAEDIFLHAALVTTLIRGIALERFLTLLRAVLLEFACQDIFGAKSMAPDLALVLVAVAQQCFTNEHVFVQSDGELQQAKGLRDLLLQRSRDGAEISPVLLAAVAAYRALYSLPDAQSLARRDWPQCVAKLVRQSLLEPLEEIEDRRLIPTMTAIDDRVSLEIMRQYEENPYPRWTINPLAIAAGERKMRRGFEPAGQSRAGRTVLIAGCGSGQHAFQVAQQFPEDRVLAIDLSLASLAYARRKTREFGLGNIDYAQADILKLETTEQQFDRIESVGVLHHLADPEQGWRILISLLRPGGEMRVGLYSETARRAIVEVRTLIAERGYRATPEDIRKCRQDVLRSYDERSWTKLIELADFYSLSGCRDLLFNVMEHRFTIPRIKEFVNGQDLTFLGFEAEAWVMDKFEAQFGAAALADLDCWQAFEDENPQAFRYMYVFTLRKN